METIRPTCSFYHQNSPEEFEVPFRIKGFYFDATYRLSKLMRYDFEIQYKKRKENIVADTLSRVNSTKLLCMALQAANQSLLQQIKNVGQQDNAL